VSTTRENLAPRVGFEPTVVGLEDRLPSFGRGNLERANRVELSHASLATMPPTMRARVIGVCRRVRTCCLRLIKPVLIHMSLADKLVGTEGVEPSLACSQGTWSANDPRSVNGQGGRNCTCGLRVPSSVFSLLTYTLIIWTRRLDLHQHSNALQACALLFSHGVIWGGRLGLHQLQAIHSRRAIYFAFNHHRLVPHDGLAPSSQRLRGAALLYELVRYGACSRTRTEKTRGLSCRCLPIASSRLKWCATGDSNTH
jgi:hypothetical protein